VRLPGDDSPFNVNPLRGAHMCREYGAAHPQVRVPLAATVALFAGDHASATIACSNASEPWCGDFVRRAFVANFGEDCEIDER
jgi:hypothetical protein